LRKSPIVDIERCGDAAQKPPRDRGSDCLPGPVARLHPLQGGTDESTAVGLAGNRVPECPPYAAGQGGSPVTGVDVRAAGELRMPMAASPASVGLAWSLVEQRLLTWGLGEDARYDAHLILAELIANAVAVTPAAGCITVHCRRDDAGIVLGIGDPSPDIPRNPPPVTELEPGDLDLRAEHFDDNGGWGLTIVTALAAACGVTPLPSGGKIVWARLRP
jgi:anti-sigma regulatory factor (Ser/Thr protein kinase)